MHCMVRRVFISFYMVKLPASLKRAVEDTIFQISAVHLKCIYIKRDIPFIRVNTIGGTLIRIGRPHTTETGNFRADAEKKTWNPEQVVFIPSINSAVGRLPLRFQVEH